MPDWLERAAPSQLGVFLGKKASPRKAGLYMRHLCRCFPDVFHDPRIQAALDVADRFEAGEISEHEWQAALQVIEEMQARIQAGFAEWTLHRTGDIESLRRESPAVNITREVASRGYYPQVLTELRHAVLQRGHRGGPRKNPLSSPMRSLFLEHFVDTEQALEFDAAWRSDTPRVSLAKHIYAARDFAQMPILADALQDAGCDNADILNHCRDISATHVRGCWVVDLVLGKEDVISPRAAAPFQPRRGDRK
ncbi:MAG: hypothetical protein U0792_25505 [Gemmataceae bacterium]